MIRTAMLGTALVLAAVPMAQATAQSAGTAMMAGTRLDIVATGEVTRVPDVARINAGVVTTAPTATDAIAQNGRRMDQVIVALRRAGVADRDIQTSSVSLNPEYRYAENQPPQLTGYRAENSVAVRFRDIARTGAILDALVAQGANQINGPTLTIDKPEEALDEARQKALVDARKRAELYAGAIGKRVGRILSISEAGSVAPPVPVAVRMTRVSAADVETKIAAGEQEVGITLSVSFELE